MLEAMSCGCLLVASNTPPVREIVRHGENGLLVDFFDRKALADRVVEALNPPPAHAELRGAAVGAVAQGYPIETGVAGYRTMLGI